MDVFMQIYMLIKACIKWSFKNSSDKLLPAKSFKGRFALWVGHKWLGAWWDVHPVPWATSRQLFTSVFCKITGPQFKEGKGTHFCWFQPLLPFVLDGSDVFPVHLVFEGWSRLRWVASCSVGDISDGQLPGDSESSSGPADLHRRACGSSAKSPGKLIHGQFCKIDSLLLTSVIRIKWIGVSHVLTIGLVMFYTLHESAVTMDNHGMHV